MSVSGEKIDKAFKVCMVHEIDPSILITEDPFGVAALACADVKAVVFKRPLPADIEEIADSLTLEQIRKIHKSCSQFGKTFDPHEASKVFIERELFNSKAEAKVIGQDIERRANILEEVARNYNRIYSWMHGQLSLTQGYHVDTIDVIRNSTVYRGLGASIITSDLREEDYKAACETGRRARNLDRLHAETHYPHEMLLAGDNLYTKSQKDGGSFGNTQALVHCTVETGEDGAIRLFSGMDLYIPEL